MLLQRQKARDKGDRARPKKKVLKTVSREEAQEALPFSEQLDQYSESDDSSLWLKKYSRTSYHLREKKVKAPSVASSTSSVSSPDLLPDTVVESLFDVKESWPGVTPKPCLSDDNSYKLETNLSETSNFVVVKKNC